MLMMRIQLILCMTGDELNLFRLDLNFDMTIANSVGGASDILIASPLPNLMLIISYEVCTASVKIGY